MTSVALLFATKEFYSAPPKNIRVETDPVINRTYFIYRGRIVAVGSL